MFEHVVLNGTAYRHLSDLPPGFAVRIQPFADLSIWSNLPQNSDLVIRTVNVAPETWPTTGVQHLPALPPSAVEALHGAEVEGSSAAGRHAAAALVELYVSHYNQTLSPAKDEAIIKRSAEKPEMVSEELSHIFPPNSHEHVTQEVTEEDSSTHTTPPYEGTNSPHQASDVDAEQNGHVDGLTRMRPHLWNDGSFWLIDIPQLLDVEIRASKNATRASPANAELNACYAVEYRRVVRYAANENRDITILAPEYSVRSGWTDEVTAAPPDQRKAFQDAVIGNMPLYSPTRLLTTNDVTLIIATFTIILAILVTLVVVTALL